PLTLLAGVNSSGKSSMLQPLLLLKQTLEAPFDPGPLLLNGPNAEFTSATQFWPVESTFGDSGHFLVAIATADDAKIVVAFRRDARQKTLGILSTSYRYRKREITLSEDEELDEAVLNQNLRHFDQVAVRFDHSRKAMKYERRVKRSRCF